jgi:hypothetical protein
MVTFLNVIAVIALVVGTAVVLAFVFGRWR